MLRIYLILGALVVLVFSDISWAKSGDACGGEARAKGISVAESADGYSYELPLTRFSVEVGVGDRVGHFDFEAAKRLITNCFPEMMDCLKLAHSVRTFQIAFELSKQAGVSHPTHTVIEAKPLLSDAELKCLVDKFQTISMPLPENDHLKFRVPVRVTPVQ